MDKPRVIVTGGAGFIGSAILPELAKHGFDVYVIDNLSFGKRVLAKIPDNRFFVADIRDEDRINEIFAQVMPNIVIHLAAVHFIPYCNQHPYESSDINIRGTINLLNACRQTKTLSKFFFASTAAVYPIGNQAIPETQKPGPLDIYGLSKLAGEHLCHEFFLETQLPVIVCRFFNAFGPNETNPHLIPEIQNQLNAGLRTIKLGNLEPKRDFIHTYDMARAVLLLLQKINKGYEVFNLGQGKEYSVKEIVKAFEHNLGQEIKIETDPARVRKIERMHLLADVGKLKKHVNWEPEWTIDQGIKTLLNQS